MKQRADVDVELAELRAALRRKLGRGGVRLTYRQGDRIADLLGLLPALALERRNMRETIRRQREQVQRLEQQLADARARIAELRP